MRGASGDTEPDAARIDRVYAEAGTWKDEIGELRRIVKDAGLTEEWKWRGPVYTDRGKNIAIIWGFKEAATLGFFEGVLLRDPEGMLEAHGPNSRSARSLRFRSLEEVTAAEDTVRAYLAEAVENARQGLKVDLPADDFDLPEELAQRLDDDPELREAWDALTPGRRRGYVLHVSDAKKPETRLSRIDKHAGRILEGKGMHDR